MHINFRDLIRRFLYGIALVGILLILCFGMSGSHTARAQAAEKMVPGNILPPNNTLVSNIYNTHIFPLLKDGNIWVVDEINGNQQQLTYNGVNHSPILATNGSKIAYIAHNQEHQPGNDVSANISIIDVDGKNPVTLTTGAGLVSLPSWSPDSNQLAFVKDAQLVTVNLQDMSSRVLSDQARFGQGIGIPNPAWSPDGKTLLCVLQEDRVSQLWSIDVDTSTKNPVISTEYKDAPYGFSPAGDITYIQKDSSGKTNLYLITAGLGNKVLLDDVIDFAWSPGGNYLAIRRTDRSLWFFRKSDKDLREISADGEILQWSNDIQFVYRAYDGIHIASPDDPDTRRIIEFQSPLQVEAIQYVTLDTPWRTQYDSAICADGNCGPASLGMTMDYFGVHYSNDSIRRQINIYMNGSETNCGSSGASWDSLKWFATTKAGLATVGWSTGWSLLGISSQIAQGHPVVLLVHYRSLPGNENSSYAYDHYIVFEGIRNDGKVVYDDPDYTTSSGGNNRTMTQQQLITAWSSTVGDNPKYSAMAVKKNDVVAPGSFNKSTPTNGASDVAVSPTLSWGTSSGATSYQYCYSMSTGCTPSTSTTNTSISLSGLSNNTTYYWQVRAVNAGGTTQADSGTYWSFTTIVAAPGSFSKDSPTNGASDVAVNQTLSWGMSSDAVTYEYCFAATTGCTSWASVGMNTSIALSGLDNDTTYYWQARAVNAGGNTLANAGAYWSFTTTVAAPADFALIGPPNGATSQPVGLTLSWEMSARAASYEYCYGTTSSDCPGWISTGTDTSVVLSGLLNDQFYYWQVRAVNAGGTTLANSGAQWFFSTIVAAPADFSKTSPENAATGLATNPTFSWAASDRAILYEYCYSTTSDCSAWIPAGTNTEVTLYGLTNTTTYYWQVRAANPGGTTVADAGTYWSFTTTALTPPGAFSKTSPAYNATGLSVNPTLYWGSSSNSVTYEYCYATTTGCTSWASVGSNTSVALLGLDNDTTYYWQVRAVNAGGNTQANSGTYWSFTTQTKPDLFTRFLPIIFR